ncbi:Uncharacterized protein DBV15_06528 [Temnothorax longispinosus]|uniref:Secreted protein n=1 Tax=Temnothorax longispinosus TaxID=300112 RepID=A0A4S2KF31_9HYME|nr:Uncharacterized protein DBV15_06528 [Temnothorax longispinosus]
MAITFVGFVLLLVACSYALPLRTASMYGSPLLVVPIIVQELDDSRALINEEPMYALDDGNLNIEKRSTEEADDDDEDDDDDLETAAGTNVLRPLFVYRQQVAYRKRVRDARRGRRI